MKGSARCHSTNTLGTASAARGPSTSLLRRRRLESTRSQTVLEIPVVRFGKQYESLEKQEVVHFETGEVLAKVHQANGGMLKMDKRHFQRARDALREIPIGRLIEMAAKAGDLYLNAKLPLGNGTQTPEEFCRMQSATTGLPEHMCAANMKKNYFVLTHMRDILDALTRGLPLDILTKGYGVESRGV